MPKVRKRKFVNGRPVRMSRFDEDRICYMDPRGNYVYKKWIEDENGTLQLITADIVKIGKKGISAKFTIFLDDMDVEEDRQNDRLQDWQDLIFAKKLAEYETHPGQSYEHDDFDPWEKVSWLASQGTDILDQILPDEKPVDPRVEKLQELLDTLTEEQRDLICDYFGMEKQIKTIAAEQSCRKGRRVSHQAVSHQLDRILTRLCKGFGVEKPVRRNNSASDDEEP